MNISDTGVNNKVQEYHDFVSVVFQDEKYMSDNREISEYFEVYWQKIMELVNGFGFKYKGQWDCADRSSCLRTFQARYHAVRN